MFFIIFVYYIILFNLFQKILAYEIPHSTIWIKEQTIYIKVLSEEDDQVQTLIPPTLYWVTGATGLDGINSIE